MAAVPTAPRKSRVCGTAKQPSAAAASRAPCGCRSAVAARSDRGWRSDEPVAARDKARNQRTRKAVQRRFTCARRAERALFVLLCRRRGAARGLAGQDRLTMEDFVEIARIDELGSGSV